MTLQSYIHIHLIHDIFHIGIRLSLVFLGLPSYIWSLLIWNKNTTNMKFCDKIDPSTTWMSNFFDTIVLSFRHKTRNLTLHRTNTFLWKKLLYKTMLEMSEIVKFI